jgi:hypothetical protein
MPTRGRFFNTGRWSALAFALLTPLVLLWLVINGRSTVAMMLAAFILPAFIEGARRWGAFRYLRQFGEHLLRGSFTARDLFETFAPQKISTVGKRGTPVRQSCR